MCKTTILIVAPVKSQQQITSYMALVRKKIGTPSGEASLSFLFGTERIKAKSPVVEKIVFDPGIPLNNPDLLTKLKSDLKKVNNGREPIFLSTSAKDASFGCHVIDELSEVRTFLPQIS